MTPEDLLHDSLAAAADAPPAPGSEQQYNGLNSFVTEQSPYPWAEGGVISTAADLDRFFTALFRGRLLPPAQQQLMFELPKVKGAADNKNCLGQEACYSIGGLMRFKLANEEYAWGRTGSRPGWDNGFFATRTSDTAWCTP